MQRVDTYEIPIEAFREAILNSFIHRDYTNLGRDIKVGIYDDILNIVSPGGFPNSITELDILNGRSETRNRIVAKIFKELNYIEQWGTGIKRIKSSCIKHGLKEPIIKESGDFVDVEIFRDISLITSIPISSKQKVSDSVTKVSDSVTEVSDSVTKVSDSVTKVSDSVTNGSDWNFRVAEPNPRGSYSAAKVSKSSEEISDQENQIIKLLKLKSKIVSSDVQAHLSIKPTRAKQILKKMVCGHLIIKKGVVKILIMFYSNRQITDYLAIPIRNILRYLFSQ